STDDVGIVSYSWNFGDGSPAGTGVSPSHTYATTGTFQVTLTVTDGGALSNSVTHPVTLTTGGGNQPPVAIWTVSCQPAPAHVCTVDGSGSTDDVGIVSYKWTNKGGTVQGTTATFTKTFALTTTVTWTLTVTDGGGKTGALTKTFSVP
ncbi:MAG: PKD domain-containing protein, partial [Gemmatimonadota bacterium]